MCKGSATRVIVTVNEKNTKKNEKKEPPQIAIDETNNQQDEISEKISLKEKNGQPNDKNLDKSVKKDTKNELTPNFKAQDKLDNKGKSMNREKLMNFFNLSVKEHILLELEIFLHRIFPARVKSILIK